MKPELILAILVIVLIIVVFLVSYILNKKTPVPEGCDDIQINDENCLKCGNVDCSIRQNINFKKIDEEIKEEL